ncbi:MAG: transglutaminase domain-containing protein [Candidatus Neomarinimicrobiota bacterium]|nr:MAG: transglutaminase domain-containing protein [Candidatus Neomarinimicrobiota bacterium]
MEKQSIFFSCFILLGIISFTIFQCSNSTNYKKLIKKGEFKKASQLIRVELASNPNLSDQERIDLSFEIERMDRIKKDFTKDEKDILKYIKTYIPEVSVSDLRNWEREKSLEYMIINGEKKYFNSAGQNFFRIDKEAKAIKEKVEKEKTEKKSEKFPLDKHLTNIIEKVKSSDNRYVCPVNLKIKQSITVKENVIPNGKVLRCWIPFPREIESRQTDIKLLNSEPAKYILADNVQTKQRTIYFEKIAKSGNPTKFFVEYQYTSHGIYVPVDPNRVVPIPKTEALEPFLNEVPPHIVFTKELQELSKIIVGTETNPYRIAQKLFEWVDVNIPWASAREYSTFRNIPEYVYENRHGDCGMQTLFFITLCRINGIPAKWQSGWEFQPPKDSMHDWGEIYFEPYGWLPMDVTYGLRETDNEELKWFYLNGMDSYRLIFNDAYSQNFYPAKIHARSETIDSQRGEVEWEGGNLYFDKWDYDLEWEVIQPSEVIKIKVKEK